MASPDKAQKAFSSELLLQVASWASCEVTIGSVDLRSELGGQIGAVLLLIMRHLEKTPLFGLPPGAQDLSHQALRDILKICKWLPKSSSVKPPKCDEFSNSPSPTSYKIFNELNSMFDQRRGILRKGIRHFLSAKPTDIKFYANRFDELIDLLEPGNRKLDVEGCSSLFSRYRQPKEQYIYPDEIRQRVIRALERHTACLPEVHAPGTGVEKSARHVTRLCLSTKERNAKQCVQFDLAIAFTNFEFWLEFWLAARLRNIDKYTTKPTEPSRKTVSQTVSMQDGDICRFLDEKKTHTIADTLPYAKLCGEGFSLAQLLNLSQHELTLKDRARLSFAVAHSFWEFYGSEQTTARWCSEDIWFMAQESKVHTENGNLELRAFVNLPSNEDARGPDECLEVFDLTHTFPRILSLGIILLEIRCGKKLELNPLTATESLAELRDSVNEAHSYASSQLAMLKKEAWATPQYKAAFDAAISSCLDHKNFVASYETRRRLTEPLPNPCDAPSAEQKAAQDQKRLESKNSVIQDRRDLIYHHVVSPLSWLATTGFDDDKDEFLVKPHKKQQTEVLHQSNSPATNHNTEMRRLWEPVKALAFHSGQPTQNSRERWFNDIREISNLIYRQRRKLAVDEGVELPPLRIVLLDTGCDLTLQSFGAARCFKGWRDFAVESPLSETEADEDGHGTFMARLLRQVAPSCEIYIARVARTREQLHENEEGVAKFKAIRFASEEWGVDIISMSFGFPYCSHPIRRAIRNVKESRKGAIVFLASAGNDVDSDGAYPASDPLVIAIYATNGNGAFLTTNTFPWVATPFFLGTYGDNIPDSVLVELRAHFGTETFGAGTSVATVVGAGIASLMLAYAALLPHMFRRCGTETMLGELEAILGDLRTTDGMRSMLRHMAVGWGDRRYFINPVRYWSNKSSNWRMLQGIMQALA